MKKCFVVDCGTYHTELLVTVGFDRAAVINEVEKRVGAPLESFEKERFDIGEKTNARSLWLGRFRVIVIMIRGFEPTPRYTAVLAHEIFHSVAFLFDHLGMRLCDASDEAYAYQIEYLTEKIFTKLMASDKNGRQDNAKVKRKKPKGSTG